MARRIDNFSINDIRLNQSLNTKKTPKTNSNFNDILQKNLHTSINGNRDVKFSKHANARLDQRNIKLTTEDIKKVSEAMDIAQSKGINNSLIVTDNVIYIANIKSRTVVTAMQSMKGRVFTNVDGVVNI